MVEVSVLWCVLLSTNADIQMEAGRFEEKYIAIIMREVLLALAYVHKCGIIHRDIKGNNLPNNC
jgi:serine/threonine protein kinase